MLHRACLGRRSDKSEVRPGGDSQGSGGSMPRADPSKRWIMESEGAGLPVLCCVCDSVDSGWPCLAPAKLSGRATPGRQGGQGPKSRRREPLRHRFSRVGPTARAACSVPHLRVARPVLSLASLPQSHPLSAHTASPAHTHHCPPLPLDRLVTSGGDHSPRTAHRPILNSFPHTHNDCPGHALEAGQLCPASPLDASLRQPKSQS